MSHGVLLIDGYNVIFCDTYLRKAYQDDADACRRRLLDALGRYVAMKSISAVVAFDGGETDEGRMALPSPGKVVTVFVRDADRYLRRRVSREEGPGTLTVVSSDESHITRHARQMGVRVVRAEEFMAELRDMEKREETRTDKPSGETKAGVEYWLERFRSGKKEGE